MGADWLLPRRKRIRYCHFDHQHQTPTMCNIITFYYCYRNCLMPERHAHKTSQGGGTVSPCRSGPHKKFKIEPGECAICKVEL